MFIHYDIGARISVQCDVFLVTAAEYFLTLVIPNNNGLKRENCYDF
jgi:hypothetical protein